MWPWPASSGAPSWASDASTPRWERARPSGTTLGGQLRRSRAGSPTCRSKLIPGTFMRRRNNACRLRLAALLGLTWFAAALPVQAADVAVEVANLSEPTLCAETDNVHLGLSSSAVRRFAIEALHPAYIGTIVVDRFAPDFRNCDMSGDPAYKFEPRRVTLYETEEWQLVGLT